MLPVRHTSAIVALCALQLATGHTAAGDVVERRGALPPLQGNVFLIDDNGVSIRSESGATQVIAWDRVRDVQIDRRDPTLADRLQTAEQLWRARSRLERGDYTMSEPLFERLFANYSGATHETALVVVEGLLRCRLHRMQNHAAVIPALEVMRLRRAGIQTDSYASMNSIFDSTTGMCMYLPPVWIDDRALRALERELGEYDAAGDEVVAALAALYRKAAQQQLGLDSEPADEQTGDAVVQHEAVTFLQSIVAAGDANHQTAIAARSRLSGRLPSLQDWQRAWARFALGRSLATERKLDAKLLGLMHLLHLPSASRFRDHEYLAGVALAVAADVLEELDDVHAAETLRAELLSRYPGHPANHTNSRYAQRIP